MRILFLCKTHGARSRLAEAMARRILGPEHEVESAGLAPAPVAGLAAELLKAEASTAPATGRRLASVDLLQIDLVVVVGIEREVAAALPAPAKHVTWPLMDPADPPGPPGEIKARFAELRTALEKHLKGLGKMRRAS